MTTQEEALTKPTDSGKSQPIIDPREQDEFLALRKKLGASSNQELISIMNKKLENTEAVEHAGASLFPQFVTVKVAIATQLFPCIRKLQSQLKSEGCNSHLSTALNLALPYLTIDAPKFKIPEEERQTLRAYAKDGPKNIDAKLVEEFIDSNFTLSPED